MPFGLTGEETGDLILAVDTTGIIMDTVLDTHIMEMDMVMLPTTQIIHIIIHQTLQL